MRALLIVACLTASSTSFAISFSAPAKRTSVYAQLTPKLVRPGGLYRGVYNPRQTAYLRRMDGVLGMAATIRGTRPHPQQTPVQTNFRMGRGTF